MNPKRSFLLVHRWTGLVLAALLLVQAMTGVMLVFRDEIERVIHPELNVTVSGEAASVQHLTDTARAARPQAQLSRLEFPKKDGAAVIFHLIEADGHTPYLVAVDPYRGTVVRQGGFGAWPTEWLFRLHDALLAGKSGEIIVGLEGVALLFMAVSGLVVWWPAAGRLRSGFRLHLRGGADRVIRSLHRVAGAILALVLMTSAITGALMIFKTQITPAVSLIGYIPKPTAAVEEAPDASLLPIDELVEAARASYGATALREVRFRGSAGQVVAVYLDENASLRENATKQISYNAYTGEELGAYVPSALPKGNGFIDWLYPVHTGRGAGLIGRLLILAGGVGLMFFTIGGVWLWLSRRVRRGRKTDMARASQSSAVEVCRKA